MTHPACSCLECKAMCHRRPCWPTPTDVEQLIAAGYGDQLMLDWWFDNKQSKTIYLITPAIVGREGGQAPAVPKGRCTFLDARGLCRLHEAGLKPTEGKLALCEGRTPDGLHETIARGWDSAEAQAVVDRWESNPPRARRAPARIRNPATTKSSRRS